MNNISTQTLKRKLRQTTWLPIGIVVALLLCAVAFLLKQQFDEKLKNTATALSDVMKSQETFFAQDVFLNTDQGIKLRIEDLLTKWKLKYPSVQACIRIEYALPLKAPKKIKGCSLYSADADIIFKENSFDRTFVKVGDEKLASIDQAVIRPTTLGDLFPPILWLTIILAVVGATLAHRVLVSRLESQILNPLLEKITEDERNAAIADTTRMVAHDIRKPFQVLRLALNTLLESKNELVRRVGVQICTDIEGSVRKVNAMLQDILDISRDITSVPQKVSATQLVRATANEVLRFFPDIKVELKFDFGHRQCLLADPEKVSRIFTNLLENAVQAIAMDGSVGTIWVRSEDIPGSKFIRFHIANSGPEINDDDAARLFSPFFTRKKGGTGLGLSISKKIVQSHGGEITYSREEPGRTCFSFTLPSTGTTELTLENGPTEEGTAMAKLKDRMVLIFDDEKYVHSHWRQYAEAHHFVTLCHFNRWEDFVEQNAFSLAQNAVAFVDVHFKNSRHDGLDVARSLRKLGVKRIYAITNDPETARESKLFDGVFGKEVPTRFESLIA